MAQGLVLAPVLVLEVAVVVAEVVEVVAVVVSAGQYNTEEVPVPLFGQV